MRDLLYKSDDKHIIFYVVTDNAIQYRKPSLLGFSGLEVLSCTGGNYFSKHIHEGYVLWLNSSSGEKYQIKNSKYILQPGCVGMIEPGLVHENSPFDPKARHLRSFYFTENYLSQISRKLDTPRKIDSIGTAVIYNRPIWDALIQLHEMLLNGCNNMAIEELLLQTFQKLLKTGFAITTMDIGQRDDQRVARIIEYFHEYTYNKISLNDLEAISDCSSFHLIRLFRNHTGLTPHAYLTQIRLEKARRFIDEGGGLADIALKSGFSDQSHLSRLFKDRYGISPGQYKKQTC